MRKLTVLLSFCFCVVGAYAQESEQDKKCVIEMKNLYRKSIHSKYQDTVTLYPLEVYIDGMFEFKDCKPELYKESCGGFVVICDTCRSGEDIFRMYATQGKTAEEQSQEFEQKTETWAAQWVKQFVPNEVVNMVKKFMQKKHAEYYDSFFVTCHANAEGDIVSVRFMITTEIYEQLTVRQVKNLYQNVKKEKIPFLTEYFPLEKPDTTVSIEFNICDLIQKGLI